MFGMENHIRCHFFTLERRNIMFPQKGKDIPFTIENYAYKDKFGRETVTWVRKYQFPKRVRRFDATMIYSDKRKRIVDYLGTHQHLAVDIEMTVAENGGIKLRSGELRFYEGFLNFKFPKTSLMARVSPGKSFEFGSSKPITLPFER